MEDRIQRLLDFSMGIYHHENGKELYTKYIDDINTVTPEDIILIEYNQLKSGIEPKEMLTFIDKLINVFHKPLSQCQWDRPETGTFLYHMIEENKALVSRLDEFKEILIKEDILDIRQKVLDFTKELMNYNEHLLKIENIIFPNMEKQGEYFQGLKIMWSLHDHIRQIWKKVLYLFQEEDSDPQDLKNAIGELYFSMNGIVQKQELILFPTVTKFLGKEKLTEMLKQSFEYEFCFIEKPEAPSDLEQHQAIEYRIADKLFNTDTGHFDLDQLDAILKLLPVDITLVDEKDEVAYFSKPKDRIFPRTAAIIGRNVRNCHPPESVHVVEEILEAFKKGEKDNAEFWITMGNKFVYIQYFPVRDINGKYRGTLEMTQEISKLRSLEGQRRLLDW